MFWQTWIGIGTVLLFTPLLYTMFTKFVKNWGKHSRNIRATILLTFYTLTPVALFGVGAFGFAGLHYIPNTIYAWGGSIAGLTLLLIGAFAFIKKVVLEPTNVESENS